MSLGQSRVNLKYQDKSLKNALLIRYAIPSHHCQGPSERFVWPRVSDALNKITDLKQPNLKATLAMHPLYSIQPSILATLVMWPPIEQKCFGDTENKDCWLNGSTKNLYII